jgi:hypothetical protein
VIANSPDSNIFGFQAKFRRSSVIDQAGDPVARLLDCIDGDLERAGRADLVQRQFNQLVLERGQLEPGPGDIPGSHNQQQRGERQYIGECAHQKACPMEK